MSELAVVTLTDFHPLVELACEPPVRWFFATKGAALRKRATIPNGRSIGRFLPIFCGRGAIENNLKELCACVAQMPQPCGEPAHGLQQARSKGLKA
ncbi:MAG: hypothetical protein RXR20_35140 [Paraburkholderia sp.]